MHEGGVRAAPTTDPGHGEMSEMRGVSARRVRTSPPHWPGRSLIRRALIFTLMAAIALGGRKLRRGHIRKPDEPRALPVEWLVEREDNQTQSRRDCGVHGTAGGRRSSAEVEQNTLPQNIYLASLFIRKCTKQPKHSTPCLDVTPLVIQFKDFNELGGWVGTGVWTLSAPYLSGCCGCATLCDS